MSVYQWIDVIILPILDYVLLLRWNIVKLEI